MKTKYLIILIVLITVSMQAQIPTLAERKSNLKKIKVSYDSNFITGQINLLNLKINKLKTAPANGSTIDSTAIKINEMQLSTFTQLKAKIDKNDPKDSDEFVATYQSLYVKKIDSINTLIQNKIIESKKLDNVKNLNTRKADVEKLREQITLLEYELKTYTATYNWFPSSKNKYGNAFYKEFYNIKDTKTSYLNSFAINYSDLGAVAQSDVIADTFGPVRMSLGTFIQSNAEAPEDLTTEAKLASVDQSDSGKLTKDKQLEALLNGGGNFYLQTVFPVYHTTNDYLTCYTYLNNRNALGIKGINNAIDTSTFNSSLGANFYFGLNSDEKKFNIFLITDFNAIVASQSVYDNLQLAKKQPFFQGKLIVGVTILDQFRLAATLNSFGSDEALRSGKVALGIQVLSK